MTTSDGSSLCSGFLVQRLLCALTRTPRGTAGILTALLRVWRMPGSRIQAKHEILIERSVDKKKAAQKAVRPMCTGDGMQLPTRSRTCVQHVLDQGPACVEPGVTLAHSLSPIAHSLSPPLCACAYAPRDKGDDAAKAAICTKPQIPKKAPSNPKQDLHTMEVGV